MPEDTGSWRSLLAVDAENQLRDRPQDLACPNDGEPYRVGPRGERYCPFDGYRPGGAR